MSYSDEIIDRVRELKSQGYTNRQIREEIEEETGKRPGLATISSWTRDIQRELDQLELDELSESAKTKPAYDYDDENLYVYTTVTGKHGEKEKKRFEIPFSIVNRMWEKYTDQGSGRTQQEIIDHNWGTEENPLRIDDVAWQTIKSAIKLNKKSGFVNKVFLKVLEDNHGEEAVNEYIEEKALSVARKGHIDKIQKSYERAKDKTYKEAMKYFSSHKVQLEKLSEAIADHEVREYNFKPYSYNTDTVYIVLTDIHYGRTSDVVEERLGIILSRLKNRPESNVVILNLGDNTESVIPGGFHDSQALEMDIIGSDQFLGIVDLFEEFCIELTDAGKRVKVFGLSQSNHERATKSFREDPERILGIAFFEMLKRGLRNVCEVDYSRDAIGLLDEGHIRFILHHGDKTFNRKKSHIILHGDAGQRTALYRVNRYRPGAFHIILSGHWHTASLESGPSWRRGGVPSPNDPDNYAREVFMACEEAGYVMINPTPTAARLVFETLV